jgi:hypothetical protein
MSFKRRNTGMTFNWADIPGQQVFRKKTLLDASEVSGGAIQGEASVDEVAFWKNSLRISGSPNFTFSNSSLTLTGNFSMASSSFMTMESGSDLIISGGFYLASSSFYIEERVAAPDDIDNYGQIWVKNESPNALYFTSDTGVDYNISLPDHGIMSGILDDDHIQYVLLAGRSGGQTISGGLDASDNLTLHSTDHATKGSVLIGTNFNWNEALNSLAITGTLNLDATSIYMKEKSSAAADLTAYGQFWIKDSAPNVPWFTDDTGTDFVLLNTGSIVLDEISSAPDSIAGKGKIWVKDDSPNTLYFTDDAGADFQLGTAGGGVSGTGSDGGITYWSDGGTISGSAYLVYHPPGSGSGRTTEHMLVVKDDGDGFGGILAAGREDKVVVVDDTIGQLRFVANDNVNDNCGVALHAKAVGSWTSTSNAPTKLEFFVTNCSDVVSGTPAMTLESNGRLSVGAGAASALLAVTSTTLGFLPPRMTDAQKASVSAPAAGLIVYNTNSGSLCLYDGSNWKLVTVT